MTNDHTCILLQLNLFCETTEVAKKTSPPKLKWTVCNLFEESLLSTTHCTLSVCEGLSDFTSVFNNVSPSTL